MNIRELYFKNYFLNPNVFRYRIYMQKDGNIIPGYPIDIDYNNDHENNIKKLELEEYDNKKDFLCWNCSDDGLKLIENDHQLLYSLFIQTCEILSKKK
jgi:hypothetical protein